MKNLKSFEIFNESQEMSPEAEKLVDTMISDNLDKCLEGKPLASGIFSKLTGPLRKLAVALLLKSTPEAMINKCMPGSSVTDKLLSELSQVKKCLGSKNPGWDRVMM